MLLCNSTLSLPLVLRPALFANSLLCSSTKHSLSLSGKPKHKAFLCQQTQSLIHTTSRQQRISKTCVFIWLASATFCFTLLSSRTKPSLCSRSLVIYLFLISSKKLITKNANQNPSSKIKARVFLLLLK